MTKLHPLLAVSLALSLGAGAISCAAFSSGGGGAGGSGASTGSGGSSSGSGGDSSGSGGTSSGSGGTTGTGGVSNSGGSTGSGGVLSTGGTTGGGGHGTGGTTTGSGGAAGASATGGTAGGGGRVATGGTTGSGGTTTAAMLPCDVLNAAGNTCVAAHSTIRLLLSSYTGPLYQVCKGTSGTGPKSCTSGSMMDIGAVGGYADTATQDGFCGTSTCTISIIYDQSGKGNDLRPAPAGGAVKSPDNPASATGLPIMAGGHKVYGVQIKTGTGYRTGCNACLITKPNGTATGDQPETEYMVTSQNGYNNGCCFDYGNAETSANDDGNGTMEAVYYGPGVVWGTGSPGGRSNPWVMADLENGLYAGWENNQDQNISTNTPLKFNFITAVVVGDTADKNGGKGRFALYGGDATQGTLAVKYDGVRPAKNGYVPMHKQGSIILGIGGDNSNGDTGEFFEGVMASGAASMTTLNAMQAAIVSANYGK